MWIGLIAAVEWVPEPAWSRLTLVLNSFTNAVLEFHDVLVISLGDGKLVMED